MPENLDWLAPLLQLNDSAFPTGGYAHSLGFEEVVRRGWVRDAVTMAGYLGNHVWPALEHFELPVVRFARAAALRADAEELLALDAIVEAGKGTRELREASRALGRRRLAGLRGIGIDALPLEFVTRAQHDETPTHHAVIFGAALAAMPEPAVLTAWCVQSLSGLCLAAPKLLRIGQDAVQRVLADALAETGQRIENSRAIVRDDLGWFDPALDLASMHHEIAHERLFIS